MCVESDGSEKLEADIPASCSDSLFSKPPQSGMAQENDGQVLNLSGPLHGKFRQH
jgi:hypothetical protein